MKHPSRPAVLFAASVLAALPAAAQVESWREIQHPPLKPFTIPQPERFVMKNGLVVLMLEDHELPLVTVHARVRAGSRLEPAEKAGLAAMTGEVMRTGGAGSRTGDEIDDLLDARGARIESSIEVDMGTASLSCLKSDLGDLLPVFADVLRAPTFDEAKIKVAKNQEKSDVARRNDNPMQIMFREGIRLAYGAESPYGRVPEYATLDAVTREDMKAFHARDYLPNRTYLGVVGDFDPKRMRALLETTFGAWPRGPESKDPEPAYRKTPAAGVHRIVKNDVTQSSVVLGHLGIRRDSPDYFAASVMNEILSGSFASRLFNNIRSVKGLAYSVRGSLGANYDYPGTFTMWLTTKTETTGAAIEALLAEVDALLAAPPTEGEVAFAKQAILNSFVFNYDSRVKILDQQLTYEYFGYPRDFLARFRENIEKVTPADVHRVARAHVRKEDLGILVVGRTEGLDRPLESFGKVAEIDVTIPEPEAAASAPAAGSAGAEASRRGAAILDKVLGAFGGAEKVDGVRTMRIVANSVNVTPNGEVAMRATQTHALPDRMRQEMASSMGSMTAVVTPSDGWVATPRGVQPLPESRRADLLKSMKRDPIVVLQRRKGPGFAAVHEGSETVEGTAADLLAVTVDGETVRWAVDPASGRILKAAYKGFGPGGVPGDRASFYADFREAGGLVLPYRARLTFDGGPMGSVEVQEIVVNPPVEETAFARPAAGPPEGPPPGVR